MFTRGIRRGVVAVFWCLCCQLVRIGSADADSKEPCVRHPQHREMGQLRPHLLERCRVRGPLNWPQETDPHAREARAATAVRRRWRTGGRPGLGGIAARAEGPNRPRPGPNHKLSVRARASVDLAPNTPNLDQKYVQMVTGRLWSVCADLGCGVCVLVRPSAAVHSGSQC